MADVIFTVMTKFTIGKNSNDFFTGLSSRD